MSAKKIIGLVFMVIGIAAYLTGSYISSQVTAGQGQVNSAQSSVNAGKSITSSNQYTKEIGNLAASPVQKKIDMGQQDIDTYTQVAFWLHVGGAIFFLLGAGLFGLSFKKT